MKKILIRFPTTGKVYWYKTSLDLRPGDVVLADLADIVEPATVVAQNDQVGEIEETDSSILRIMTDQDRQKSAELKKIARNLIEETQKKVNRHSLNMTILDADLSFDEKKLTFYFSADGRVDFRSLVTDLAKSYNKLIRLQQVGARDEARLYGGIGKCGRELCCATFLKNFESITLEMAELQELSTAGSAKLSGCCGKLMCCLAFEAQNYQPQPAQRRQKMPQIDRQLENAAGQSNKEGKRTEV
jgi:cell fate regulator YaaT (PSP1 superfamily)